jgi:hypothetical protein
MASDFADQASACCDGGVRNYANSSGGSDVVDWRMAVLSLKSLM